MRAHAIVLAAVLASRAAHADDARSPDVATYLSAGTSVLGAGLVLGSNGDGTSLTLGVVTLLLGPSAGHWYAGNVFSAGMGIRAAGLATAGFGVSWALGCDTDPGCSKRPAYALIAVGLGGVATGAIWDTVTAGDAVRDWNRRHAVSVVPTVSGGVTGLALVGTF